MTGALDWLMLLLGAMVGMVAVGAIAGWIAGRIRDRERPTRRRPPRLQVNWTTLGPIHIQRSGVSTGRRPRARQRGSGWSRTKGGRVCFRGTCGHALGGLQFFRICDGFRTPAHRDGAAHTGAGVRKPPGNEGAGLGQPGQRALWGIGWHWACSRGPVQRALERRMRGVGAMVGQSSVENARCGAFRGLLHGSDSD